MLDCGFRNADCGIENDCLGLGQMEVKNLKVRVKNDEL
jgi:hypothetical protein